MKNVLIAAIFLFGFSAILYIDHEEALRWDEKREILLSHTADLCQIHIEDVFTRQGNTLKTVAAFIIDKPLVSQDEFSSYGRPLLDMFPALKVLRFNIASNEMDNNNAVSSLTSSLTDESFEYASGQGAYTVKTFDSGEVDIQTPLNLNNGTVRVIMNLPIYKDGVYLGVLVGEYDIHALLAEAVAGVRLGDELIVSLGDGRGRFFFGEILANDAQKVSTIKVANMEWELLLKWKEKLSQPITPQRIVFWVFGAGVLICGGFLYFCSQKLESTVKLRTQELTVVNKKLKDEIHVHQETSSALLAGEERYRALFDHNPIQTIVVDEDAKIVMYNFAKNKIQGSLPVIGAVMYKDYATMHEIDMYAELFHCIQTGKLKEFSELRYKDRVLRVNIAPFSGGAIITSIDITSTKVMSDQLQQKHKMEAIGTLAGGIAHDFNNILGIIVGNAELAADDIAADTPAHESLEEIELACMRARDVVKQLLSFSRQSEPINKPLNISIITEDTLKLLRASIPKSIEISSFIPEKLETIKGNISQIQQVLINLCTNAANSMEENGGILTVNLRNRSLDSDLYAGYQNIRSGHYVELEVSDTGHGIGSEIRGKIFDPYFTTREVGKGSGMGLSVVLGILKNHEAYIWVDSQVEKGTVVKVLFPVVREFPQEVPGYSIIPQGGTESILYVDDEVSLLRTGRNFLERFGYQVETYMNPLEALKAFYEDPYGYDMVISDISMPYMSGDKLVEKMFAIRKDIPIVLCSGYSDRLEEKDILALGVSRYIEKPFEIKYLASVVREVLDTQRQGSV